MIFFVVENFEFSGIASCYTMCTIPTNYTEAINSEDSQYWVSAMCKKFDSLVENNTFQWQKALKDKNIVGSRWVFTLKYKQDESYEYKTQFVAKSFSQIYGKDYREIFALTTSIGSIRLLLQVAPQYDLLIHLMDVKSKYLNTPLKYKICWPTKKALKVKIGIMFGNLKRSSYGLKQSGQTWNKTFPTYLITQNFELSPVDPCMYVQNINSQISINLLWY